MTPNRRVTWQATSDDENSARIEFWHGLHERLAQLSHRLDAETRGKVMGAVHARVPMVTPDEQRAL